MLYKCHPHPIDTVPAVGQTLRHSPVPSMGQLGASNMAREAWVKRGWLALVRE